MQNEIIYTTNSSDEATTFVNWGPNNYKFSSNAGLKNYDKISYDEITHLLNSKCLFGRKFNAKCMLHILLNSDYEKHILS